MNPGDVVLIALLDAAGTVKVRPAVYLAPLPGPYQTLLVCGCSTQIHTLIPDWDELLQPGDGDFAGSGLRRASVIRLSYLRSARPTEVQGVIGRIDPVRLARLRTRLADQVRP
jgi:mRNA interferase MazF